MHHEGNPEANPSLEEIECPGGGLALQDVLIQAVATQEAAGLPTYTLP